MPRNPEALKVRAWGPAATTKQSPEDAGLDRNTGWPDAYGLDQFPPLGVFNQFWLELTSALVEIAQRGVLEWHTDQAFLHPCFCIGSDNRLYTSVQDSGGTNTAQDPTTDTGNTYWRPLIETSTGRLVGITNANLEGGTNTDDFVTAAALLSLFGASPNARWIASTGEYGLVRLGTQAEVDAGDADRVVTGQTLQDVVAGIQPTPPPNASTSVRGLIRIGTDTEVETGSATDIAITPAALLSLFGASPNARWRAATGEYGLVRLGTQAEIDAGNANRIPTGQTLRGALPGNSSTTARGLIRTATVAEAEAGTASGPAVTPEGLAAAIQAQAVPVALVDQTTELAAGQHTFTIASPTTYRWFEFSVPEETETHFARVPRAAVQMSMDLFFVVDDNTNALWSVDPATGVATRVSNQPLGVNSALGLASHGGILYVVDDNTNALWSVDPATGVATRVSNQTLGVTSAQGLASHGGVLYVVDSSTDALWSVDPATGVATRVSNQGLGITIPTGLTSHGGVLYVVDSGTDALWSVDPATGVATRVSNQGLGVNFPQGLASHGGVLYVVDSGTDALWSVDPATGRSHPRQQPRPRHYNPHRACQSFDFASHKCLCKVSIGRYDLDDPKQPRPTVAECQRPPLATKKRPHREHGEGVCLVLRSYFRIAPPAPARSPRAGTAARACRPAAHPPCRWWVDRMLGLGLDCHPPPRQPGYLRRCPIACRTRPSPLQDIPR